MTTFRDNYNINVRYVGCPYDQNHRIPANRLPKHLISCEKRSQHLLIMCPFNGSHRVRKEDFEKHMNRCRDQSTIIFEQIITSKTIDCENKSSTHLKPESEDDWDSNDCKNNSLICLKKNKSEEHLDSKVNENKSSFELKEEKSEEYWD